MWFESPGDGKSVTQKAVRRRQKRESVTEELPVIQQFRRAVNTPETSDAQPALWHLRLRLHLICATEQNNRGTQQHSVLEQLHALKQFGRFPAPWWKGLWLLVEDARCPVAPRVMSTVVHILETGVDTPARSLLGPADEHPPILPRAMRPTPRYSCQSLGLPSPQPPTRNTK